MKPAQIVLLVVALLAGGLAAFLATRGDAPVPVATTEVVSEPKTQILVAATPIGVAERLSLTNVVWQDWPESAMRPEYVTIAAMPDAPNQLTGTVARFEFFPGEPIREEKLVRADQGYLSAVLEKGKRGVSIPVQAASGSGGFIVPNDRVDVVLTHAGAAGEVSETILSNVKVLAIGQRLGEVGTTGAPADPENKRAEIFADSTIATLELDPAQGETLINSTSLGRLSLVLRSIADFNEAPGSDIRRANQPIRVIRYGQESSLVAGVSNTENPDAGISPAAFQPITVQPSVGALPMTDTSSPSGALPVSEPAN